MKQKSSPTSPNKDDEIKIEFAPSFIEDMQHVPVEERAELMAAIAKMSKRLKDNPYAGTPLWGGRFHVLVVFWNFIKRKLWDAGIKIPMEES